MNKPEHYLQVLDRLNALPAIPKIAREILSLKITTQDGEQALLKLIKNDPPITAKIIGMANSPMFGASRRIVHLDEAEALLGLKRIKMTALSFAMMTSLVRKPAGVLNVDNLWLHGMTIASVMNIFARYMPVDQRPNEEDMFLAGLLHDIGFLVLDYIDPGLSDKFHARLASESDASMEEIENELLDMSHCKLGSELGRRWNLPKDIISTLQNHHQPSGLNATKENQTSNMIHLAEKILPPFSLGELIQSDIDPKDWQGLGINPSKADEIIEKIREQAKEMVASFG